MLTLIAFFALLVWESRFKHLCVFDPLVGTIFFSIVGLKDWDVF